jgi:hypothetical protein
MNVTVNPKELTSILMWARDAATLRIARDCMRIRLSDSRNALEVVTTFGDDIEVPPSHKNTIASTNAVKQVLALTKLGATSGGVRKAKEAFDIACEFFEANGTAYRALERGAEWAAAGQKKRHVGNGGEVPSYLDLWLTPSIPLTASALGAQSLIGVDRERLLLSARRFYLSGLRCPWFEKMLVEALIGAELFATVQESRKNPTVWGQTGLTRVLLWAWSYERTKGKSGYTEYLNYAMNLAIGFAKLIAVAGLAWFALAQLEEDKWITGYAGIAIAGWAAANMLGRFVVSRIVSWAKPPGSQLIGAFRASPIGQALFAMTNAYSSVSAPTICPQLASASLAEATRHGAALDPIAAAFL